MVSFECNKRTGSLETRPYKYHTYLLVGPPYKSVIQSTGYMTSPKLFGQYRRTGFNRTRKFRAGQTFTYNPFLSGVMRGFEPSTTHSETRVTVQMNFAGSLHDVFTSYGNLAVWANAAYANTNELTTVDESRELECLQKAVAKSRELQFDAAVFIAELSETINLLTAPLQGAHALADLMAKDVKLWWTRRHYLKWWPKFQRSTPADYANALASQWLEYRYGLTPFIRDITAILEIIKNKLSHEAGPKRFGARYESPLEVTDYLHVGTPVMSGNLYVDGRTVFTRKLVSRASFMARLSEELDELVLLGLDWAHAPQVIWEKVPLSFVLDWLLRVSTWLKSIEMRKDIQSLCSCTSSKIEERWETTITGVRRTQTAQPTYPTLDISHSFVFERGLYQRRTDRALPALPQVNSKALSIQQTLDLITLTWQRINASKPSRNMYR